MLITHTHTHTHTLDCICVVLPTVGLISLLQVEVVGFRILINDLTQIYNEHSLLFSFNFMKYNFL